MTTRNKNGELSAYGLHCGYVDRIESGDNNLTAELYEEGGVFHVRLFDRSAPNFGGKHFNECISGGRFWWSFYTLTPARKLYRKLRTAVKRGKDYSSLVVSNQGEL